MNKRGTRLVIKNKRGKEWEREGKSGDSNYEVIHICKCVEGERLSRVNLMFTWFMCTSTHVHVRASVQQFPYMEW